jgi:hypothetical protein
VEEEIEHIGEGVQDPDTVMIYPPGAKPLPPARPAGEYLLTGFVPKKS